jgi:hypothetical protein
MGGPALAWVIKVMSWAVASTVNRGYNEVGAHSYLPSKITRILKSLSAHFRAFCNPTLALASRMMAPSLHRRSSLVRICLLLIGLGILPSSSTLSPLHTHSTLSVSAHLPIHPIDPRTGVCIVDLRSVHYASSSKINILVLNRAPLSAAAWSYYYNVSACSNE